MKLKPIVALALIASAAITYAQATAPALAPSPAPAATLPSYLGRYQIVAGGNSAYPEIWMIDTQTGDTWRRTSSSSAWTYAGNPTQNPGPRYNQTPARGRATSLPAEAPLTARPATRPMGMP